MNLNCIVIVFRCCFSNVFLLFFLDELCHYKKIGLVHTPTCFMVVGEVVIQIILLTIVQFMHSTGDLMSLRVGDRLCPLLKVSRNVQRYFFNSEWRWFTDWSFISWFDDYTLQEDVACFIFRVGLRMKFFYFWIPCSLDFIFTGPVLHFLKWSLTTIGN